MGHLVWKKIPRPIQNWSVHRPHKQFQQVLSLSPESSFCGKRSPRVHFGLPAAPPLPCLGLSPPAQPLTYVDICKPIGRSVPSRVRAVEHRCTQHSYAKVKPQTNLISLMFNSGCRIVFLSGVRSKWGNLLQTQKEPSNPESEGSH